MEKMTHIYETLLETQNLQIIEIIVIAIVTFFVTSFTVRKDNSSNNALAIGQIILVVGVYYYFYFGSESTFYHDFMLLYNSGSTQFIQYFVFYLVGVAILSMILLFDITLFTFFSIFSIASIHNGTGSFNIMWFIGSYFLVIGIYSILDSIFGEDSK